MSDLGIWFRNIPPFRAAVGLLMMAIATSFTLGAASMKINQIPARIGVLESRTGSMDTILVDLTRALSRHIEQDSIATARIYCVVEAMYEGETVNPLECERDTP